MHTLMHRRPRWRWPMQLRNDDFEQMMRRWWEDGDEDLATYPVDIREDDKHIYVEAELPGFNKDEIEVTLEQGVLSIRAQRKTEEKKGEQHLVERRFQRVARSFTLPGSVDENQVQAELRDGVLTLTLAKNEAAQPRRIEVK
ncbi:MAG: Hsp20/alpha crystallin family protein [bacterium]